MSFWKILRILTTNQCNYRCLYCHNEGQDKSKWNSMLSYEDFFKIASVISKTEVKEVRFSGGEPLINPHTIEMIEWLNSNSEYEIGLATNGSMITDDIAQRLGKTRTLVTLHFPAANDAQYMRITGNKPENFWNATDLLDKYNVSYSFNYVLYPETIENIIDVVEYALEHGKRIKLLPFIEEGFNNYSSEIIEKVKKQLDQTSASKSVFDNEGITTWTFEGGGKVKLLASPCYDHNIRRCREYGELRLLPDLSLQKCIFDNSSVSLVNLSENEIIKSMSMLWSSFNQCLK